MQHYQGCLRSVPRIRTASFLMRRATLPSSALTTPVFFQGSLGLGSPGGLILGEMNGEDMAGGGLWGQE